MTPVVSLPCLTDEDRFEDLCLALWKKHLADPSMLKNGRRGQRQAGVDFFGRRDGTANWVGVQCKVKAPGTKLTKAEIDREVAQALSFNPKLNEFVLATTAPRDAKVQEYARVLTATHQRKGLFSVTVESWHEIAAHLADPKFTDIFLLFYKNLVVDVNTCGSAVGVLVALEIGVAGIDSHYEFMLGRTPFAPDRDGHDGLNYHKNRYFIASLQGGGCDIFRLPVYSSDLEVVFPNNRDRFIICEWLNSLDTDLDKLIRGDDLHQRYSISADRFKEYMDSTS